MEGKKLNVFISWSKDHAKTIAKALSDLLQAIFLGEIKVFLSSSPYEGIKSGENPDTIIYENLMKSNLGFLILTKNNFGEPWLIYEAGALLISTNRNVIPIIIDRDDNEIEDPLKRVINYTKYNKATFYERVILPIWEKIHNKNMQQGSQEEHHLKTKLESLDPNTNKSPLDILDEKIMELLNSRDYKVDVMQYTMQKKGTYYTRGEHLANLISHLDNNSSKRIIIIGVPQKILDNFHKFVNWAQKNTKSQLYICHENQALLLSRRKEEVTKENQEMAKDHIDKKIAMIKKIETECDKINNVHFVEINKKFSNYVTIDGTNIYVTPVFNKRSSNTFTLLFSEKNKQEDIIDYVKSKVEGDTFNKKLQKMIIKELDDLKSELK